VAEGWQRQRRVMAAMAALPVAATAIAAAVLTDVQYSAGGAGGSWARTSALNFAWGPLRRRREAAPVIKINAHIN